MLRLTWCCCFLGNHLLETTSHTTDISIKRQHCPKNFFIYHLTFGRTVYQATIENMWDRFGSKRAALSFVGWTEVAEHCSRGDRQGYTTIGNEQYRKCDGQPDGQIEAQSIFAKIESRNISRRLVKQAGFTKSRAPGWRTKDHGLRKAH